MGGRNHHRIHPPRHERDRLGPRCRARGVGLAGQPPRAPAGETGSSPLRARHRHRGTDRRHDRPRRLGRRGRLSGSGCGRPPSPGQHPVPVGRSDPPPSGSQAAAPRYEGRSDKDPLGPRWRVRTCGAIVASGAVTALADTPAQVGRWEPGELLQSSTDLRIVHPILAVIAAVIAWWLAGKGDQPRSGPARAVGASVGAMLITGALNVAFGVPTWMQLSHLVLADALGSPTCSPRPKRSRSGARTSIPSRWTQSQRLRITETME